MFAEKCLNCGLRKWEEPPPKHQFAEFASKPIEEDPTLAPETTERLRLAKFLTLVVRDDPKALGLRLDSEGWADVNNLLTRANRYGFKLTREDLAEVLTASENPSFEWDQPGDRIRWVKS